MKISGREGRQIKGMHVHIGRKKCEKGVWTATHFFILTMLNESKSCYMPSMKWSGLDHNTISLDFFFFFFFVEINSMSSSATNAIRDTQEKTSPWDKKMHFQPKSGIRLFLAYRWWLSNVYYMSVPPRQIDWRHWHFPFLAYAHACVCESIKSRSAPHGKNAFEACTTIVRVYVQYRVPVQYGWYR